jgi:hypothetical protein
VREVRLLDRPLARLHEHAPWLLVVFCLCLVALNVWRLEDWGSEGFADWFGNTIMQTTLFDFGWVLLIVTFFIHHDARRHGLSYWWIIPSYPFMPTIGLLAYFIVRQRVLKARGEEAGVPEVPS